MSECPILDKESKTKFVSKAGNSGRVYVPKSWKKVLIIKLE